MVCEQPLSIFGNRSEKKKQILRFSTPASHVWGCPTYNDIDRQFKVQVCFPSEKNNLHIPWFSRPKRNHFSTTQQHSPVCISDDDDLVALTLIFLFCIFSIHYTSLGRGELCSRIRRLTLTGALSVSSLGALPPAGRFAETNNNPLRSNSDSTYYLSNTWYLWLLLAILLFFLIFLLISQLFCV